MCEPATIASMAMSGVGYMMQQNAADEAASRQQSALNASLESQDKFNRQAEQKALENAGEYAPEQRVKRFEEARQNAGDSLAQSLVTSREAQTPLGQTAGRLSEEFNSNKSQSEANQLQSSLDMARAMGKMRGASDMMTQEGYTNADYASQLGAIGSKSLGQARADQVGINAAGRPDAGQQALGGLMSGLGSAGMSYGAGQLSGLAGTAKANGTNMLSQQTRMLNNQWPM